MHYQPDPPANRFIGEIVFTVERDLFQPTYRVQGTLLDFEVVPQPVVSHVCVSELELHETNHNIMSDFENHIVSNIKKWVWSSVHRERRWSSFKRWDLLKAFWKGKLPRD